MEELYILWGLFKSSRVRIGNFWFIVILMGLYFKDERKCLYKVLYFCIRVLI